MRFRDLLAQEDFRRLWIGQVCSQLGDRLTQMILIAVVAGRFPGSPLALAKIMACTLIPSFLVSPFAGAYVDRWDRRRTMLVCDLGRALCVAALPVVVAWPTMPPVYALVLLLFAIACFFFPARLALLPALVPPGALVAANSLLTTSGMVAATMSVLIGGLLVEQIGVAASCAVAAGSYLSSAGCILLIRHRAVPMAITPRPWALLREIWEGIAYVLGRRHAQFVLGILFLMMGSAGATFVVTTILVQQAMGTVTQDIGLLSAALSVGLFLGTVLYGRLGQSWDKPSLLLACVAASGAALTAFATAIGVRHAWGAGLVTAALLGMAVAPIGIAVNTMIHELVHGRLWGRIFSAMGIVMNAALLTGLASAGLVAERVTPLVTLWVVGGSLVMVGIVGLPVVRLRRARAVL